MSPTNRHKYKYFHSTVQRGKDRRQKFHFCRLPFDVRPRNVKLNLSIIGGGCATVSSLTNPMRDCERAIAKRKGILFLECPVIFIAIPF